MRGPHSIEVAPFYVLNLCGAPTASSEYAYRLLGAIHGWKRSEKKMYIGSEMAKSRHSLSSILYTAFNPENKATKDIHRISDILPVEVSQPRLVLP